MRRDRTGELLDDDEDLVLVEQRQPHHCDGGWIDRDSDQPRPCPVCRPHLVQRRERLGPADPDRIRAGLQLCRDALARARGTAPQTTHGSTVARSDRSPRAGAREAGDHQT